MDSVQKLWFQKCFSEKFSEAKYSAFQELFSDLMESRHGADFSKICPWGAIGDLKCDGFLNSTRTIFQVYAPREVEEKKTIGKISDDFEGAKINWPGLFSRWVFVHNDREGLSPNIKQVLLGLGQANPSITIEEWGFRYLAKKVRELDFDTAISLFGVGPQPAEYIVIGYQDIEPLFDHFAQQPVNSADEVRPVPAGKLNRNGLSIIVQDFLKTGMRQQNVVANYFAEAIDPELGERVATAFRRRYEELKREGREPDDIFDMLQLFAGGSDRGPLKRQIAVFAVLAYLFDRCDIFERPEEVAA